MTMLKNKKFNAALLGAAGVIALCAQQAFAFGGMGGGMAGGIGGGLGGGRIGGIGAGRIGSVAGRAGTLGVGAVTVNGITVLPNGAVIVPAACAKFGLRVESAEFAASDGPMQRGLLLRALSEAP